MQRPRSGRACLRRPRRPRPRLLARLVASQRRREAAERAARSLPGTAFRRCWRRSCAAEHAAGGQRGVPATAPGRRARAPCATYARRANVRRLRGEERADKTCLFHHFHPKSIMPSSPIDLREHLDHGRADPGAARLPRAVPPQPAITAARARIGASLASCFTCARVPYAAGSAHGAHELVVLAPGDLAQMRP